MRIPSLAATLAMLAVAVTATAQTPTSISAPRHLSLTVGHDTTLTLSVKDPGGATIPGATVQLASADTSVVTVAMDGSLHPAGPGTATITATAVGPDGVPARSVTANISVTVSRPGMETRRSTVEPRPVKTRPRR